MTKFKVGDKVRIIDTDSIMFGATKWKNGDTTDVTESFGNGDIRLRINRGKYRGTGFLIHAKELRYIEHASSKPTKNHRITTLEQNVVSLESEVAELKAKVEALEKADKPSYKIAPIDIVRNDADITKVASQLAKLIEGETDKRRKKMSLTPNELRKAIIAEAKAFVATKTHYLQDSPKVKGGWAAKERENPNFCDYLTKAEFIVNTEKRTVVALIRYEHGSDLKAEGIAKCAPDDVFNADIGKAIALGRALGLDVSRFEQAVKPTEFAVGQIVTFRKSSKWHREFNYRIDSVTKRVGNLTKLFEGGGKANADLSDNAIEELPVIDDTEAQY